MNNSRPTSSLTRLECCVVLHVSVMLLFASWAFGGNIWWARLTLSIWGSLALPLTLAAFCQQNSHGAQARRKLVWLLPPVLYATLVFSSTYNPSFSIRIIEGTALIAHKGADHPNWPSTVSAIRSLDSLWFGAGAYLSAFNLVVLIRSRRALRFLFVLMATNTLALAVFGTLQKLSSSGFYLGAAISPNKRFFATFIYNNHWGACMILGLSTAMGLLFYHARKYRGRDLWHSPFTAAVVGVLLIAATGPVSASRAATGIAALMIAIATVHASSSLIATRRGTGRPVWPAVSLLLAFVLIITAAVGWLSYRSMNERYVETRAAIDQNQSLWGERFELYRDTWKLAQQEPIFGWGLSSYDIAFQLIRPRPLQANRQYESSYATAHNDWLQSLVETGVVGTALLIAMLAMPLSALPRRQLRHPLVLYPFIGLTLVILYALIEFPFSSGALLITFWILFFSTLRHAALTDMLSPDRP